MTQEVDSAALHRVAKTLQLSTPGQEQTLFIDERLEQTLDVAPIIRRGLTLANTEGLYSGNLRNTHTGSAAVVVTTLDPWSLAGAETPPFPAEIPTNLDLWLLGFSAKNVSGAGNLDSAFFDLANPSTNRAFGTGGSLVLAGYTGEFACAGANLLISHGNSLQNMYWMQGLRIIRNATFRFHTLNVGATSPIYDLDVYMGLFPSALGQDGAV